VASAVARILQRRDERPARALPRGLRQVHRHVGVAQQGLPADRLGTLRVQRHADAARDRQGVVLHGQRESQTCAWLRRW
jgi:hypothetical protein